MPSSFVVPIDTYNEKSGDVILQDLKADVAAASGGTNPSVSDVVRDAVTGKLVSVRLMFPDGTAQEAVDAINANPGVVSTCLGLPIPQRLIGSALSASGPDGIVWSGTLVNTNQRIRVWGDQPNGSGVIGWLADTGYAHQTQNNQLWTDLQYWQNNSGFDMTIPANNPPTLNFANGDSLQIQQTNDIVLVGHDTPTYYVDVDGKLYYQRHPDDIFTPLTFDFSASCYGPI